MRNCLLLDIARSGNGRLDAIYRDGCDLRGERPIPYSNCIISHASPSRERVNGLKLRKI